MALFSSFLSRPLHNLKITKLSKFNRSVLIPIEVHFSEQTDNYDYLNGRSIAIFV
jgi:hypothetical protein